MKKSLIIKLCCGSAAVLVAAFVILLLTRDTMPENINLERIVTQDSRAVTDIFFLTEKFCSSRNNSELVLKLVFNLTHYVPNFKQDDDKRFWISDVNPMLTDCIIQQHETEDVIFRAFDNVNMAVTIVMNGINLIRLNPSTKGIQLMKNTVGRSLTLLDETLTEVQSLQMKGLSKLRNNTNKIVGMMGPAYAEFVESSSQDYVWIDELTQKKKDLWLQIAQFEGDAAHYQSLIRAMRERLETAKSERAGGQTRIKSLDQMITKTETDIAKVPDYFIKERKSYVRVFGIKIFSTAWKDKIENLNSKRDKAMLKDVIDAKLREIQKIENKNERYDQMVAYLSDQIAYFTGQNTTTITKLDNLYNQFEILVNQTKEAEEELAKNKLERKRSMDVIKSKYRMTGPTLFTVLTNLKRFPQMSTKQHFAPLVSVIQNCKTIIEFDVMRLENSEGSNMEWIIERTTDQLISLADVARFGLEQLRSSAVDH